MMTDNRPENCRNRVRDDTGIGPKSGCYVDGCGGVFGVRVCEAMENNAQEENNFLSFDELKLYVEYWGFDSSNNIFVGKRVADKFVGRKLDCFSIDEEQFGLIKFIIAPKDKPKPSKYEKHLYGNDFNVAGIIHDIKRLTIDPRKVQLNKEKTLVLIDWLNDVLKGNIK